MNLKEVTKFKTNFISEEVPDDKNIEELKEWCSQFLKNKLINLENNSLGLSFRTEDGFIITGNKLKEDLSKECFVSAINYDVYNNSFYVDGLQEPSLEAIMHFLIYNTRDDVNAILCGSCDSILKNAEKMKLPITNNEQPSGTMEFANEILDILDDNNFIVIKNCGFVSLGRNMKEAGNLALNTLKKA